MLPSIHRCHRCGAPYGRTQSRDLFCSEVCAVWAKVYIQEDGECWPWTGATNAHGYGHIRRNGTASIATRVIYRLVYGEFDKTLFVCHRCDNPTCCNPHHLFLGTDAENKTDMYSKGRWSPPPIRRGERNNLARLTADDVRYIRNRLKERRWGDMTALAKQFNVSRNHILRIKKRIVWAHID